MARLLNSFHWLEQYLFEKFGPVTVHHGWIGSRKMFNCLTIRSAIELKPQGQFSLPIPFFGFLVKLFEYFTFRSRNSPWNVMAEQGNPTIYSGKAQSPIALVICSYKRRKWPDMDFRSLLFLQPNLPLSVAFIFQSRNRSINKLILMCICVCVVSYNV